MPTATRSASPVLISNVKPVAFGMAAPSETVDILIGGDGTHCPHRQPVVGA